MKDLDKMLKKQAPLLKQGISSDFTQKVIMNIQNKKPARWTDKLFRKLRTKLSLVTAAGMLLLGGTAAALSLWPIPSVTKTTLQQLPSGNHIVGYNAKNCNYFGELDGAVSKETNENIYYEVQQGSPLDDEQLQSSLQGICEENISNNAVSAVMKLLPASKRGDSGLAYTITGVTPASLTVSPDSHYDAKYIMVLPNQTYTRFDSGIAVFDQTSKSGFDAIRVGDTVKLITRDTSGVSPETQQMYTSANHPENQLIMAVVKIPAPTADPTLFYTSVAQDIVRVEPCTSSPSGFCRAYDFAN